MCFANEKYILKGFLNQVWFLSYRCTLTRVDIWESLTVKQWLEIVGCTQQDTEWVQELSQTGKRIREYLSILLDLIISTQIIHDALHEDLTGLDVSF